MIGLVTDSASQITPELAARLSVSVVPVIVMIDGVAHREGVDLGADEFWHLIGEGVPPAVSTSQPSPGDVVAVYRDLVARGATEIVSIHVGAEHSGTLNAVRLAAAQVDVPVHAVDTGTASFGVACCVWEAATALASGADAARTASRAGEVAATVGTTFVIQALDFARRGGRLGPHLVDADDDVPVLGGIGGAIGVLGTGRTVDELCDAMVAPMLDDGRPFRAGVALADPSTAAFADGIEARLRAAPACVDLVRYRVGPSIAAHTGPGTAGGFWYPVTP